MTIFLPGEIFCRSCYGRNFGPHGYGFGQTPALMAAGPGQFEEPRSLYDDDDDDDDDDDYDVDFDADNDVDVDDGDDHDAHNGDDDYDVDDDDDENDHHGEDDNHDEDGDDDDEPWPYRIDFHPSTSDQEAPAAQGAGCKR